MEIIQCLPSESEPRHDEEVEASGGQGLLPIFLLRGLPASHQCCGGGINNNDSIHNNSNNNSISYNGLNDILMGHSLITDWSKY